jgi:hypothetical protein
MKSRCGTNATGCDCFWKSRNSTTSKLDLPRIVEALSTNLLSVTRSDFFASLLPDADSELRVTTLYNPEARGSLRDGTIIPIHGSICGKAFWTGTAHQAFRLVIGDARKREIDLGTDAGNHENSRCGESEESQSERGVCPSKSRHGMSPEIYWRREQRRRFQLHRRHGRRRYQPHPNHGILQDGEKASR